jgi:hypothetical protein
VDSQISPTLNLESAAQNHFKEYPYQQITNQEIEQQGFDWFSRDNLPDELQDGVYIVNLDRSSGGGTHWRTLVIQYPQIYLFDPFGIKYTGKPNRELMAWGKRNGFQEILCNEWDVQPLQSWLCGWMALQMAQKFKKHLGSLTEKQFDQLIKQTYDTHPTANNVQRVTKWSIGEGLM